MSSPLLEGDGKTTDHERKKKKREREGGERAGHLPDKGFGIKVGALVWKIHTRHGIEVVGALDVAE